MTIQEAENQYYLAVEQRRKELTAKAKKALLIWNIIASILIVTGIILTILGFTAPPQDVFSDGSEIDSMEAIFMKVFGIVAMYAGVFIMIFINVLLGRAIKKGQINVLPYINALYLNYLKCEDMSPDDKEFYKQKLEDIRNANLVNAIHGASAAASAAIIFSALHR